MECCVRAGIPLWGWQRAIYRLFSPRLAQHLPPHHTSGAVNLWMWHLLGVSFPGTVCLTFVETRGGRVAREDVLVQQDI